MMTCIPATLDSQEDWWGQKACTRSAGEKSSSGGGRSCYLEVASQKAPLSLRTNLTRDDYGTSAQAMAEQTGEQK